MFGNLSGSLDSETLLWYVLRYRRETIALMFVLLLQEHEGDCLASY